jgi:hypothetical protein
MTNETKLVKLPVRGAVHEIIERLADSFIATYGVDAVEYVGWLKDEIGKKTLTPR